MGIVVIVIIGGVALGIVVLVVWAMVSDYTSRPIETTDYFQKVAPRLAPEVKQRQKANILYLVTAQERARRQAAQLNEHTYKHTA